MFDVEPHLRAITQEARRLHYLLPLDHAIELQDLVSAGVMHSIEFLRFDGVPSAALVRANARCGMLAEIRRWDHGTKTHPVNSSQFVDIDTSSEWKLKRSHPAPPMELMIDLLREILKLPMRFALPFVSHCLHEDGHEVSARELGMVPVSMKNYVAAARKQLKTALVEYTPQPAKSPLERAEALLRSGHSVPSVAKAVHTDPAKLYALQDRIDPTAKARRAAQAKQMRTEREDISTSDLVKLRAAGMTIEAIAKHIGCSMQLVNKRLKKLGVDTSRIDSWHRRQQGGTHAAAE